MGGAGQRDRRDASTGSPGGVGKTGASHIDAENNGNTGVNCEGDVDDDVSYDDGGDDLDDFDDFDDIDDHVGDDSVWEGTDPSADAIASQAVDQRLQDATRKRKALGRKR